MTAKYEDCVTVSIMLYLADKYQQFIPSDPVLRAEVMNWLFWQVGGQGPITGACFGHFFVYAPGNIICHGQCKRHMN
jgi:glutathione S-transferase